MQKLMMMMVIGLLGTTSLAAPFTYDELVNGDLVGASNIGTLGVGDNIITGTASTGPSGPSDLDEFILTLPSGLEFSAISTAFSNIDNNAGAMNFQNYTRDIGDSNELINLGDWTSSSNGTNTMTPIQLTQMNASAGSTYRFTVFPNGSILSSSADWEWTVTVIPEPASMILLGLGSLAVIGRRHRKIA